MFITFEGGEGSGKSTQIRRLAEKLSTQGHQVTTTREPGGSPAAEDIRSLLVTGDTDRWSPMAEVLLNYAARAMHLEKTVRPALKEGHLVLCDRFSDSTLAYQGYAGGVDRDKIKQIHDATLGEFSPDLTLVLDLSVEEGLARAGYRASDEDTAEDRFERKGIAYHQKLRDGFLEIARNEPARCRVVDASGDLDEVAEQIYTVVSEKLAETSNGRG